MIGWVGCLAYISVQVITLAGSVLFIGARFSFVHGAGAVQMWAKWRLRLGVEKKRKYKRCHHEEQSEWTKDKGGAQVAGPSG